MISRNVPFPKRGRVRGQNMPFCYICGRQFSSASIGIHEPQCLKKWKLENDRLPESMRRPAPVKPIPIKEKKITGKWKYTYDATWEAAQANLVPCPSCGRTFAQDRITTHQKICIRTGIVPGLSQAKPNIDPKSPFAIRMSYKPPPPNSDYQVTANFRKGRWAPKEQSPRTSQSKCLSKPSHKRGSLPTPRSKPVVSKTPSTHLKNQRDYGKLGVSPRPGSAAENPPNSLSGQTLAKFCTNWGQNFVDQKAMICSFCFSLRKAV